MVLKMAKIFHLLGSDNGYGLVVRVVDLRRFLREASGRFLADRPRLHRLLPQQLLVVLVLLRQVVVLDAVLHALQVEK